MGTKIYTETDRSFGIVPPAIAEAASAQIDLEIGNAWHALRIAEQRETKTADKASETAEVARKASAEAAQRRLALGRLLVEKRKQWSARGPKAKGWGDYLALLGIEQHSARDYMNLAGYVEDISLPDDGGSEIPSRREVAAARRADEQPDPAERTRYEPIEVRSERPTATLDPASAVPPTVERTGGRGKPSWLMRALVRDYTYPADLVCDPLAGFGTTLRAALDEGRRAIGSEIDPKIAEQAGTLPIRVGKWQVALADETVDAIIVDPPYSARTHSASRKFGNEREDGSSLEGLGPEYGAWTVDDVHEFVVSWSPRCRGWMVALTDHHLIPAWQSAYEAVGRYSFAPVSVVIRGMTVRLCGDGPSSETLYCMVARPSTIDASRYRTLPGHYVGTKGRSLDELLAEAAA